jgi:hypothetical protein
MRCVFEDSGRVHAPCALTRPVCTRYVELVDRVVLWDMNATTLLEQAGAEFRQATTDARLVALARTHPDWHVWRSSDRRWYGTRRTCLSESEKAAGCARTVHADSLDGLIDLLADQEAISSRCIEVDEDAVAVPAGLIGPKTLPDRIA